MAFFVDLYQLMGEGALDLPNLDSTDGSQVEVSVVERSAMSSSGTVQGGRRRTRLAWSMGQHGHQRQRCGVSFDRTCNRMLGSIERGDHVSAIGFLQFQNLGHFEDGLVHPMRQGNSSFNACRTAKSEGASIHAMIKSGFEPFGLSCWGHPEGFDQMLRLESGLTLSIGQVSM